MSTNLQTDLKIYIEIKRVKHDKANFKKKDKVEICSLTDFTTYSKVTLIKKVYIGERIDA